jgi:hypothetical protein
MPARWRSAAVVAMRLLGALGLVALLAGCMSSADVAEQHCARLGYWPGDAGFERCLRIEAAAESADRDRYSGMTSEGLWLMSRP